MQSTIHQAEGQLSCDVAGEFAVMNLKTGTHYGLDQIGARIWTLIQQPKTFEQIRDTIVAEYDVDVARCEADLLALLRKLKAEGLIETREG